MNIRETHEDDGVRLKLLGELDLATAPELLEVLGKLSDKSVPISIDLSELEYMDSTGLTALLRARQEADANGWRLRLLPNVSPQVRRLFEMTGSLSYLLAEHPGNNSTG